MLCLTLSTTLLCQAGDLFLRFGVITDTHIGNNEQSCDRVKAAYQLFRDLKVDLIVHCGDIADLYYPTGYQSYRKVVDWVFEGSPKPKEIFVYAFNHDAAGAPSKETAYKVMKENLKISHDPYDKIVAGEYTFLVFPEDLDMKRYEETIAAETKRNPGKPLFVVNHVPAFDTVYNSRVWGSLRERKVLDKYPEVIQIAGHVHGTPRNELDIWQGAFTAVSGGTLQIWDGELTAVPPARKRVDMALLFEVYRNRIVIRRYHTQSKTEYRKENPWTIPLPFNSKTAPYNHARRAALCPRPVFEPGAMLEVKPDQMPFRELVLRFPEAKHPEGVFKYRIEGFLRDGKKEWMRVFLQEIYGNFHLENEGHDKYHEHRLSGGFCEPDMEYRFTVTPVNWYEREGKALEKVLKLPAKAPSKVVWETENPMEECPFLSGFTGGNLLMPVNGFYRLSAADSEDKLNPGGSARLIFPAGVWKGEARKTRFRFTVDMQTVQKDGNRWTLVLRNPDPILHTHARISTPPGDSGVLRYVLEFAKINTNDNYYLLVREGGEGLIKFKSVKIERLD